MAIAALSSCRRFASPPCGREYARQQLHGGPDRLASTVQCGVKAKLEHVHMANTKTRRRRWGGATVSCPLAGRSKERALISATRTTPARSPGSDRARTEPSERKANSTLNARAHWSNPKAPHGPQRQTAYRTAGPYVPSLRPPMISVPVAAACDAGSGATATQARTATSVNRDPRPSGRANPSRTPAEPQHAHP